jgi:hypothetical protein
MTEMYESCKLVYLPTNAMETVSKSLSCLDIRDVKRDIRDGEFLPPAPSDLPFCFLTGRYRNDVQTEALGEVLDDFLFAKKKRDVVC